MPNMKTAESLGFAADEVVLLLAMDSVVGEARIAGGAPTSSSDAVPIRRTLHGTTFSPSASEDMVVVRVQAIHDGCGTLPYPYADRMPGSDDVPSNLLELHPSAYYIWDAHRMRKGTATETVAAPSAPAADSPVEVVPTEPSGPEEPAVEIVPAPSSNTVLAGDDVGTPVTVRKFLQSELSGTEIHVTLSQIAQIEHPLRDVNSDHVNAVKQSFRVNGFDYSRGMLSVTLDSTDALTTDSQGRCILRSGATCRLFDGRHRLQALTELSADPQDTTFGPSFLLRVCLVRKKDGTSLSPREILFCSNRANSLTSLVLTDNGFVATIQRILRYAATFRMDYGVDFAQGRVVDIATDLFNCDFLPGARLQSYKRFVRVAKFFNMHPEALSYVVSRNDVHIGVTHLDDSGLVSTPKRYVVHLLQAVYAYLSNPSRPKGDFPVKPFYNAAIRYLNALSNVLSEIREVNPQLFDRDDFAGFMAAEIPLTKTSTTTVASVFCNGMRLFEWDDGARNTALEARAFARQKKGVVRVRNQFVSHDTRPQPARASTVTISLEEPQPDLPPQQQQASVEEDEIQPVVKEPVARKSGRKRTVIVADLPPEHNRPTAPKKKKATTTTTTTTRQPTEGKKTLIIEPTRRVSGVGSAPGPSRSRSHSAAGSVKLPAPRSAEHSPSPSPSRHAPSHSPSASAPPPHTARAVRSSSVYSASSSESVQQLASPPASSPASPHPSSRPLPPRTPTNAAAATRVSSGRLSAPKSVADIGSFADDVPSALPIGYEDRVVPKRSRTPSPELLRNLRMPELTIADPDNRLTVQDLLFAAHVPAKHRAHVFLQRADVLCLRRIACLRATDAELRSIGFNSFATTTREEAWKIAKTQVNNGYAYAYFVKQKALLAGNGYTILDGFGRYIVKSLRSSGVVSLPPNFPPQTVKSVLDAVYSTFPGEQSLRDEGNRDLWSPIINAGEERDDEEARNKGAARYTSMPKLLMEEFEKEEHMWVARCRALLDVWLGMLALLLNIDENGRHALWMPATGGRFLISGGLNGGVKPQVGHNDFPAHKGKSPGYFFIVTGNEVGKLYVCKGSHHYVFYPTAAKRALAKHLKLESIELPPNSVFVGHGWLQHAGAEYLGYHNMRYHLYFVPEGQRLGDSVSYSYGWNLKIAETESRHNASEQRQPGHSSRQDNDVIQGAEIATD